MPRDREEKSGSHGWASSQNDLMGGGERRGEVQGQHVMGKKRSFPQLQHPQAPELAGDTTQLIQGRRSKGGWAVGTLLEGKTPSRA